MSSTAHGHSVGTAYGYNIVKLSGRNPDNHKIYAPIIKSFLALYGDVEITTIYTGRQKRDLVITNSNYGYTFFCRVRAIRPIEKGKSLFESMDLMFGEQTILSTDPELGFTEYNAALLLSNGVYRHGDIFVDSFIISDDPGNENIVHVFTWASMLRKTSATRRHETVHGRPGEPYCSVNIGELFNDPVCSVFMIITKKDIYIRSEYYETIGNAYGRMPSELGGRTIHEKRSYDQAIMFGGCGTKDSIYDIDYPSVPEPDVPGTLETSPEAPESPNGADSVLSPDTSSDDPDDPDDLVYAPEAASILGIKINSFFALVKRLERMSIKTGRPNPIKKYVVYVKEINHHAPAYRRGDILDYMKSRGPTKKIRKSSDVRVFCTHLTEDECVKLSEFVFDNFGKMVDFIKPRSAKSRV